MKTLKKYLITLGVQSLAVLIILLCKDVFIQTDPEKIFHILCDAFFAIGVVATGFGLLIFSTNEGVFDGLVYGVGTFIEMFKKVPNRKYQTLFDYKMAHADKKLGFGFLLICGLAFLAISMVMYLLYCKYV